MMNREQILNMIEGYGADLQSWPISNQQAVSEYIAADKELSWALSTVVTDESIFKECFTSSEPQWSLAAEKILRDKIISSVESSPVVKKIPPGWRSIIQRFIDPAQVLQAFPAVVAMLLLMVVVQVVYKDETTQLDIAYSNEELRDWLVFEGMNDVAEIGQDSELLIERVNNDLGKLPEFVYYL